MKHDRLVSCHVPGDNMLLLLCLTLLLSPILPTNSAIASTDVGSLEDDCSSVHCPELPACPDDSRLKVDADDGHDNDEDDYDMDVASLMSIEEYAERAETSTARTPTTSAQNVTHQRLQRRRRQTGLEYEQSSSNAQTEERCCGPQKCICRDCPYMPKCPEGEVALELSVGTAQPGSCCTTYVCAAKPNCNAGGSALVNFWPNSCKKCSCILNHELCFQICQQDDASADSSLYQDVNHQTPMRSCFSSYWQIPKLHGESWLENNDCSNCSCVDGENDCITSLCAPLDCEDTVKIEGRCCRVCKTERSANVGDDEAQTFDGSTTAKVAVEDVLIVEASTTTTATTTTTTTTTMTATSTATSTMTNAASSATGRPSTAASSSPSTSTAASTVEPLDDGDGDGSGDDSIAAEPTHPTATDVNSSTDVVDPSAETTTDLPAPETTVSEEEVETTVETLTTSSSSVYDAFDERTSSQPDATTESPATETSTTTSTTTSPTTTPATTTTTTTATTTATMKPTESVTSSVAPSSSVPTTSATTQSSALIPLADDKEQQSTATATTATTTTTAMTTTTTTPVPVVSMSFTATIDGSSMSTIAPPTPPTVSSVKQRPSAKPATITDSPISSSSDTTMSTMTTTAATTTSTSNVMSTRGIPSTSAPALLAPESNSYRQSEPISEQDYRFATNSESEYPKNADFGISYEACKALLLWLSVASALVLAFCVFVYVWRQYQQKSQRQQLYSAVPNSETNLSATTTNTNIV